MHSMADCDFSTLFELLPIGAYRSSPDGRQLRANPALVKLDGYETEAELLAATKDLSQEWYVDPHRREQFKALLERDGRVVNFDSEVYRHRTRERIWVRVHAHVVRDAQGAILYYEGTVQEITAERLARQALEDSERRFRALTELSSDWYWEMDTEFRFTRLDLNGKDAQQWVQRDVIGRTRRELCGADLNDADWENHLALLRAHKGFRNFEFLCRNFQGEREWHCIHGEPMFDATGKFTGYQGVGRNVTERRQRDDEIRQLAFHDTLTGLPNRRLMLDRLQQAILGSARRGQLGALLFLDLDNLKTVNDEFGHQAGDDLLVETARRLRQCVRANDTVARLGGDEFIVLMEDLGSNADATLQHARGIAEKMLDLLRQPCLVGPQKSLTHCHASIGAVVIGDREQSAEAIIRRADAAMYSAKTAGGDMLKVARAPDST